MKLRNTFFKTVVYIKFCVLFPIILGLTGCDLGQISRLANYFTDTRSPYPVHTSKLAFAGKLRTRPIIWIDNDRIVFAGGTPTLPDEAEKSNDLQFGIYIWDTKNDTYTLHKKLENAPAVFCYHDGYLVYSIELPTQHQIIIGGRLGEERELQPRIEGSKWPELSKCLNLQPESDILPEHASAFTHALQNGDGYLYLGSKTSFGQNINGEQDTQHAKLYSVKEKTLLDLPILLKEFSSSTTTYSKYGNQYVFVPGWPKDQPWVNHDTGWPAAKPLTVYMFSNDGNVSTTMVPAGYWNGRPQALPTKKGLLIVTNNAPGANSKNAGGYLLTAGKMKKLYDHLTNGIGVSPDGCKIVYSYNDYNRWTKDYMRIIDLCR
jgi:hypothetical protein